MPAISMTEDEHDGREPSEDELHFFDSDNKAIIHAAHEQAQLALRILLKRLRPDPPVKAKLDATHP